MSVQIVAGVMLQGPGRQQEEEAQPGNEQQAAAAAAAMPAQAQNVFAQFQQQQQQQPQQPAVVAIPIRVAPEQAASSVARGSAAPGGPADAAAAAAVPARRVGGAGPVLFDPSRFLADLGLPPAVMPGAQVVASSGAGYVVGYGARVFTRVAVFVGGVSGLALYALHKQGLIDFKWARVRDLGVQVMQERRQQVEEALAPGPQQHPLVAQIKESAQWLISSTHGVAFSVGFFLAFK